MEKDPKTMLKKVKELTIRMYDWYVIKSRQTIASGINKQTLQGEASSQMELNLENHAQKAKSAIF